MSSYRCKLVVGVSRWHLGQLVVNVLLLVITFAITAKAHAEGEAQTMQHALGRALGSEQTGALQPAVSLVGPSNTNNHHNSIVKKKVTNAPSATTPPASTVATTPPTVESAWFSFKSKHAKVYANSIEEAKRFTIFKRRFEKLVAANAAVADEHVAKGKPGVPPITFSLTSPLNDIDDATFQHSYLAGPPQRPTTVTVWDGKPPPAENKTKNASKSTKLKTAAKARFLSVSGEQTPNLPSPRTVRAPFEGTNMAAGRTGGGGGAIPISNDQIEQDKKTVWMGTLRVEKQIPQPPTKTIQIGQWGFIGPNFKMILDYSNSMFPDIVRNQGTCNSCWATATTEHIQAIWYDQCSRSVLNECNLSDLAMGGSVGFGLSAQLVLDCVNYVGYGCSGGTVMGALEWIKAKGLKMSQDYPNQQNGVKQKCLRDTLQLHGPNARMVFISNYGFVTYPCLDGPCVAKSANEDTMRQFMTVQRKPLLIYVDASNWSAYKGGIFPASQCSSAGDKMSHIVQIVGFGQDTTTKEMFWLVR